MKGKKARSVSDWIEGREGRSEGKRRKDGRKEERKVSEQSAKRDLRSLFPLSTPTHRVHPAPFLHMDRGSQSVCECARQRARGSALSLCPVRGAVLNCWRGELSFVFSPPSLLSSFLPSFLPASSSSPSSISSFFCFFLSIPLLFLFRSPLFLAPCSTGQGQKPAEPRPFPSSTCS